ncbi:PilZ domain protein [compost metagenome]
MLAGFIASLVLGALGGFLLGRTGRPRPETSPESPSSRKIAEQRIIVPTVDEEIARALRQGAPLTVIYLTWETLDETDPTLRLIESMLVRLLRPYDAIVPLGEGRFALVLPQVGEGAADTVAARLMQELTLLASVQLTSSESDLPRVSMTAPFGVKAIFEAALEASELAPPWRGDRGQLLRIGMAVLERPEVPLLGRLEAGTVLRLRDGDPETAPAPMASRVELTDPLELRVKPLDPVFRLAGDKVVVILEWGRLWMRAEVDVLEVGDEALRLSVPRIVHRVPRRRVERFRMRLPVQLADLEGFTLNLSADGFRAVFPIRAFAPGQILDGGLALPEERHPVRVEVIKVRATDHAEGMIVGCRFIGLEKPVRLALEGLLNRQPQIG